MNHLSTRFMAVASVFALATMLIACFGVSNIVMANLAARRFEYGVIRAVGGQAGMLARQVIAETILLGLVAGVLGSALGLQLAMIGQVFHRRLVGVSYDLTIPWDIVAWGWLIVIVIAILAAGPAIGRLFVSPRNLLQSS